RLRDPLVGRDVLLGVLAGLAIVLVWYGCMALPPLVGLRPLRSDEVGPGVEPLLISLLGVRFALGQLIYALGFALTLPLGLVPLLLMCRRALRSTIPAVLAYLVLTSAAGIGSSTNPVLETALRLVTSALVLFVLFRWGLLVVVVL